MNACAVSAGGRLRQRLETPLQKPVGGRGVALREGEVAAWRGDAELQRRTGYALEVAATDDGEQPHGLARPVQSPVGMHGGAQPLGVLGVNMLAAHVEAAPAQPPVATPIGHERGVLAVANDERHGLLATLQVVCRWQAGMAALVGTRLTHRQAVLAEQRDAGAGDWRSAGDGVDEDVLAVVDVGLRQEAEVGDQGQAPVGAADLAFALLVPAAHGDEKHAAVGQKRRQVQRREHRLARMLGLQVDDARGELGNVVGVERPVVGEPGVAKVAAGLAGEVVHGVRQQLLDIHLDRRQAARREGETTRSGERQHGAVLGDGRLLAVRRHARHGVEGGCHQKAAGRLQAGAHAQVDEAPFRRVEGGALRHRRVARGGVHRHRQAFRLRQDFRRHFAGGLPAVVVRNAAAVRAIRRQQPGGQPFGKGVGFHLVGEGEDHGLPLVLFVVLDKHQLHIVDAEETGAIRHLHLALQRLVEYTVAACRRNALGHGQVGVVGTFRDGQGRGVQRGAAIVDAVLEREVERFFAAVALRRQRDASLQRLAGDRVREAEARHHPAFVGSLWMLVEEGGIQFDVESWRLEENAPARQLDVAGEQARIEAHSVFAPGGPVFGRLEDQQIVRLEAPPSGHRRLHGDARIDDVADQIQPRRGERARWRRVWIGQIVERQPQRLRPEFVVDDGRDARRLHLRPDAQRLRQPLVVPVASGDQQHAAGDAAENASEPSPAKASGPRGRRPRQRAERRLEERAHRGVLNCRVGVLP